VTTHSTYVVHTHYVPGALAPAEVIVVPLLGEWHPYADPSPVPPGRDTTGQDHFPSEWWSRQTWHSWHVMPRERVTVAEPVPSDGSGS
jgi:hypothetical protein